MSQHLACCTEIGGGLEEEEGGGGGGGGGLEEEAFLELSHDSCQELPKRKTIDKLDS